MTRPVQVHGPDVRLSLVPEEKDLGAETFQLQARTQTQSLHNTMEE